jgi:hypothetical protein
MLNLWSISRSIKTPVSELILAPRKSIRIERLKLGKTVLVCPSPVWFIRAPPPNAVFLQLYQQFVWMSSEISAFLPHNPGLDISNGTGNGQQRAPSFAQLAIIILQTMAVEPF